MNEPRRTTTELWPLTKWLFGLVLLCALSGVILGIWWDARAATAQPAASARPSPSPATAGASLASRAALDDLERRFDVLRVRIDTAEQTSRGITTLLSFLLGITSLYALALGLNSYFSLERIFKNAKEDAERNEKLAKEALEAARSQVQEFRDRIRSRYPELADLRANLEELLGRTGVALLAGKHWSEQAYHRLAPRQREQYARRRSAPCWPGGFQARRLSRICGRRTPDLSLNGAFLPQQVL